MREHLPHHFPPSRSFMESTAWSSINRLMLSAALSASSTKSNPSPMPLMAWQDWKLSTIQTARLVLFLNNFSAIYFNACIFPWISASKLHVCTKSLVTFEIHAVTESFSTDNLWNNKWNVIEMFTVRLMPLVWLWPVATLTSLILNLWVSWAFISRYVRYLSSRLIPFRRVSCFKTSCYVHVRSYSDLFLYRLTGSLIL